jgi:hypothetical protein
MLRFAKARRERLAEKSADLANFAVAGLVFAQAVGEQPFSLAIAVAGISIWAVFMACALALKGGGR